MSFAVRVAKLPVRRGRGASAVAPLSSPKAKADDTQDDGSCAAYNPAHNRSGMLAATTTGRARVAILIRCLR